ncbi:MAG: FAD-binding protein [Micromonosporaceae bacterium]|nr:FAD-binding protein [Micromonosporaceae bacterium]
MNRITRRSLLAGTAAAGGTLIAGGAPARAVDPSGTTAHPAVTVRPDDFRYDDLIRGENLRWVGSPDYIKIITSPDQVTAAVQEAVSAGKRIAVRSGGHCYEDFVTNPEIQVVLDLSKMNAIYYDDAQHAIAIEAGATVGEVCEALFKGWGVTLPAGSCPSVGFGGHVAGGGYGQLNRSLGLVVDYLYAVEVVVVGADGSARRVIATARPDDPYRDLWWAHTGGGGGNFGVVTRYWFRGPGPGDAAAGTVLPKPPGEVWINQSVWPWAGLTEAGFSRLMQNFGRWCEQNSGADTAYSGLFSRLFLTHQSNGLINMATQMDASVPDAEALLRQFVAAVADGVGTPQTWDHRRLPWFHSTTWRAMFGGDATGRADFKSTYMRRGFPDSHIAAFHHHLTRTDYANPGALVEVSSYGGRSNTVSASATAVPQRDSVMKMMYLVAWGDATDDAVHLGWIREFYRDVYATTGGVPVPSAVTDGCFINYADIDLSDPAWNTSGVPWYGLYYKDNYPRLQQVKARWDPSDAFRHAQSIRLP